MVDGREVTPANAAYKQGVSVKKNGGTLLLTRPLAQSQRFLADCEARLGRRIDAVISPIIEIVPTGDRLDLAGVKTVIVTSGNAVRLLGEDLKGRKVVTVGAGTAELAISFGATAETYGETAQQLLANARRLVAPVLVCRGVHARIDLADELNSRGIKAWEAVLYDQAARDLSAEAFEVLSGKVRVVAPVFSPRSARLLRGQIGQAPAVILAMSDAVAEAWGPWGDIRVAAAPTSEAMCDLVTEAL